MNILSLAAKDLLEFIDDHHLYLGRTGYRGRDGWRVMTPDPGGHYREEDQRTVGYGSTAPEAMNMALEELAKRGFQPKRSTQTMVQDSGEALTNPAPTATSPSEAQKKEAGRLEAIWELVNGYFGREDYQDPETVLIRIQGIVKTPPASQSPPTPQEEKEKELASGLDTDPVNSNLREELFHTGEPLDELVSRFLAWTLPDSVCSDLCVIERGVPHRSGTNLLTADEAKRMLEHVLDLYVPRKLKRRDDALSREDQEAIDLANDAIEECERFNPGIEFTGSGGPLFPSPNQGETYMTEKTLHNSDVSEAKKNVPDIKVVGNGDSYRLLCKASSQAEGWMKSSKAMEVPHGCVVQVTTQQKNIDGTYSIAEALTFVPGVKIADDDNNGRKLVAI